MISVIAVVSGWLTLLLCVLSKGRLPIKATAVSDLDVTQASARVDIAVTSGNFESLSF